MAGGPGLIHGAVRFGDLAWGYWVEDSGFDAPRALGSVAFVESGFPEDGAWAASGSGSSA